MRALIAQYIEKNEGRRVHPYRDTVGKLTIGVGFNIDDVGLYDNEIDFILDNRIKLVTEKLKFLVPDFETLGLPQRTVLTDLGYNLGIPKLSLFKQFLGAVNAKDWGLAAVELLDSKYAAEVPARAKRNSELIKDSSWNTTA